MSLRRTLAAFAITLSLSGAAFVASTLGECPEDARGTAHAETWSTVYISFCCTKKTKTFKPGDVSQVTKTVVKDSYRTTGGSPDGHKNQEVMGRTCGGSSMITATWSDVHASMDSSEGHSATCN
jgi:hypothetical protein